MRGESVAASWLAIVRPAALKGASEKARGRVAGASVPVPGMSAALPNILGFVGANTLEWRIRWAREML